MNLSDKGAFQLPDVLPADAVALLAGVSFGSVLKVMWALNAIKSAMDVSYDDLLNPARISQAYPDAVRFSATPVFIKELLSRGLSPEIRKTLETKRRFGI